MYEPINYASIASELYKKHKADRLTEHDVEKYNGRSGVDKGKVFYIELANAMANDDKYVLFKNQRTKENVKFSANVNGVLLHSCNPKNNNGLLAVIGKKGSNWEDIVKHCDEKFQQVIRIENIEVQNVKFGNYKAIAQLNDNIEIDQIICECHIDKYTMGAIIYRNICQMVCDYCKGKINEIEKQSEEPIPLPKLTIVNKYVLLHELGIIQLLKDRYSFDDLLRPQQTAILRMILGLDDEKAESSIKGILSSPRAEDRNYPLKIKNVNLIWGELTKLGIIKPTPVKGLGNK